MNRSSRPEVFCKKGVLRNFAKFTGKHLCQILFVNEVAGLRPASLLKERLWHRCFPVDFVRFLRTPFYIEHLLVAASAKIVFVSTINAESTLVVVRRPQMTSLSPGYIEVWLMKNLNM